MFSGTPGHYPSFRDNPGKSGTVGMYVIDRNSKAHWSETELTCISDKSKLIEWMEYLIENIYMYIKVGNRVYRQIVGIPMGTDCAPQLANLFLFHFK